MRGLAAPLLLAGVLVAAGFFWRGAGFDLAGVLPDRGVLGAAMFVGLGTGALLLGLPRQAVAFAGGAAFGVLSGGTLAWVAAMLSCAVAYAAARAAWRRPRVPDFLARAEAGLRDKPFAATLALRLLPVGHNLGLTLFCGALRVRAAPFLAGSALGYVPQTVVFALLGAGAAIGRTGVLVAGSGLLIASILGGIVLQSTAMPQFTATDPGAGRSVS